jgi:hypothetical protein
MTDTIQNYPKSSCACYECDKNKYNLSHGVPTNMSVRGCKFSPSYDCQTTRVFKEQQEPSNQRGGFFLNPAVIADNKFATGFKPINVRTCPKSSCNGTTYLNSDPRLYNAAGPSWLQLDRPPLDSSVKLSTLHDDKTLNCYGQNYKSYADVNAGQVLYYISKDREDAFYEPLFSKKATSVGIMYKDPMGSMKPHYNRIPEGNYNPISDNPCDVKGEFGLSWMKDSQFHREDLLARQMQKINQTRFEPRWTHNNV